MGLMLSLRGSVSVYQGEELALPSAVVAPERMQDPFGIVFYPEFPGRDGSRTPMPWVANAPEAGFTTGNPWLPLDPRHAALSVDAQEGDPRSMLQWCRQFLAWRKTHPALIEGELEPVAVPEPLIAFRRSAAQERLIIVLNLGNSAVPLPDTLPVAARPLHGHGFDPPQHGVLPRYGMYFGLETTEAEMRPLPSAA